MEQVLKVNFNKSNSAFLNYKKSTLVSELAAPNQNSPHLNVSLTELEVCCKYTSSYIEKPRKIKYLRTGDVAPLRIVQYEQEIGCRC